ncbi:vWA domain-containing protein [Vibrio gangliei]|uniref:vWA domain-containing protein n=1 Tax=Vibrio gangliei TaxID=2077090 RepID=UPI000D01F6CA|nr:VWA domain-containing protein [Vibrio gangliei]
MADFQLLHPAWLYAAIPAIVLSVWLYRKPKSTSLIAAHLSQQLGLEQHKAHGSVVTTLLAAWLIAVIALSGPSFQKQSVPSFGVNNARVIVMDMTLSMYATDLAPNRLSQARYKVLDLLPKLQEGTTGLVAYSGDGYMISPLTNDSNTLASLIPNLSPNIMPTQGSDAAAGVKKAIDMLTQAGHQQGDIILIADGLSNVESEAIQDLLKDTHWNLSVMSVGTAQGAPIRLPNGDLFTHDGTTVVAKTDLKALQEIAQIGHGVYTPLRNDDGDIQQLSQSLNHVELKTNKENKETPDLEVHINNGFWLLPILLVLALGAFRRGGIFSLAFLAALPLMQPQHAYAAQSETPQAQTNSASLLSSVFKTPDQQGYDAYQAKQYPQAASAFDNQAWKGAALYQAGNYQAAIKELQGLTSEDARYNLANAQAQAGQLEQAKQGYEDILKANPNNADAKKNLEIVKKALEQQKQQQQKQQDQQQNQNSQDQNKQQQDKQSQDQSSQNSDSQDKSSQGDQSQQNSDQKNHSDQNQSSTQNQNSNNNPSSDEKPSSDKSNSTKQNQSSEQSNSQQSNDEQQSQQNNDKANSSNQQSEQQKQAQQEQEQQAKAAQKEQQKDQSQDESKAQAMSAAPTDQGQPTGNTVAADPRLNKLEQIPDNAQRLLQAQMALEAQQKPAPQSNGQLW